MRYNAVMSLNNSISIRFDEATKSKLSRVSEATGFKESDLVRRAVENLLTEIEETGALRFPVNLTVEPLIAAEPTPQYGTKPRKKKTT